MKKKLVILLSILFLWGCESVPTKTLKQHVTLLFFYIDTCSECKAFKKEAIPYLEKTFGDSLTIDQYDWMMMQLRLFMIRSLIHYLILMNHYMVMDHFMQLKDILQN